MTLCAYLPQPHFFYFAISLTRCHIFVTNEWQLLHKETLNILIAYRRYSSKVFRKKKNVLLLYQHGIEKRKYEKEFFFFCFSTKNFRHHLQCNNVQASTCERAS